MKLEECNEMQIKNLKMEQEIRDERRKKNLSLEGCYFIAGSLLGWMKLNDTLEEQIRNL